MLHIHPNARTTPAVRIEIARSIEPSGTLAKRYGISAETVRKWRKRGAADCLDHSARPHRLPWKASDEERAVVCALRQATNFTLDDLTFVVTHSAPSQSRQHLAHSQGVRPQLPATSRLCRAGEGARHLQGLRPRLHPHRHQAPTQAANSR